MEGPLFAKDDEQRGQSTSSPAPPPAPPPLQHDDGMIWDTDLTIIAMVYIASILRDLKPNSLSRPNGKCPPPPVPSLLERNSLNTTQSHFS